jgi:hypothetical protein
MHKFWLCNPKRLFSDISLIPVDTMSFEDQLNSITRLVIAIYIILGIMDFSYSLQFLILSLLMIILIFLINKEMNKEKFLYSSPQENVWCTKPENVQTARFASNAALWSQDVRGGNPKTKIPPIVPPKSHDQDYWKPNEFVVRSEVNEMPRKLWKQSGYYIPENYRKPYKDNFVKVREPKNSDWKNSFNPQFNECCAEKNKGTVFNNVSLKKSVTDGVNMCGEPASVRQDVRENFELDRNVDVKYGVPLQLCQPQDGDMIDGCGYNPRKTVYSNLPSNQPSGVCQEFPTMAGYNESLNTQILQPGVYTQSQVMEPQVYNMGISHTQQFQPVDISEDQFGNKIFTQQNPRLNCSKNQNIVIDPPTPNESNVFDPRMNGYGSNNRAYIDPLTGRPRFYYDDINAVREGNFFIKSNVDALPFTDHRGAMRMEEDRKDYLNNHRQLVDNGYLNGILQNRTEMSERLMRKYQEKTRQQKQAPIRFNDISRKY